ncbi:MAG: hypothetical protein KIT84_02460 [Labilithrix sp.]|nr:hypothetical protein [Labilithrix sp.]MCW5809848.1 hypothetical protein [Labilithrix sp.]
MRVSRWWLVSLPLSACASFGTAPDGGSPVDGGTSLATCDAGLRCFDFEPPHDTSPFGFDEALGSEGEITVVPGPSSANALRLYATTGSSERGLLLAVGTIPAQLVIDFKLHLVQTPGDDAETKDAILARLGCADEGILLKVKKKMGVQLQVSGLTDIARFPAGWQDVTLTWRLESGAVTFAFGTSTIAVNVGAGACAGEPVRFSLGWLSHGAEQVGTFEALVDDVRVRVE